MIPPIPTCLVCSSTAVKVVHRDPRFGLEFGRCSDCWMHFAIDPPAVEGDWELVDGVDDWPEYVAGQRGDDAQRLRVLERLRTELGDGHHRLFDVGTGVGDFVVLARAHGFDATGNDLSQRGVELALERNGLSLTTTSIDDLPSECADAITVWCVLAHVQDPGNFIDQLFRRLRPGGVLFLRTPGWSIADRYGFGMARLS